MHRVTVLAVLAVGLLLLSACNPQDPDVTTAEQVPTPVAQAAAADGASPDAGGGGQVDATVEFTAVDIDFEDVPDSTTAGNVEFVMNNEGSLVHNMHIEDLGDRQVIADTDGGTTGTGTAQIDSGTITMYCSIPGHRSAGMETTIQVE